MPALLARKALASAAQHARFIVLTDDPMAVIDVPHMCHTEGYVMESLEKTATHARMVLTRP